MLAAVDEGVEGPADVVPVHPQVPGEVVAGARRDAGVGQCVFGGRGGDDRLGSVLARRRERVHAAEASSELLHFITPIQFHGLDRAWRPLRPVRPWYLRFCQSGGVKLPPALTDGGGADPLAESDELAVDAATR